MRKESGKQEIFDILEFKNYFLIVNVNGFYEHHTHFNKSKKSKFNAKQFSCCIKLVKSVKNKEIPKSKYGITSAIRITLDEDYRDKLRLALQHIGGF